MSRHADADALADAHGRSHGPLPIAIAFLALLVIAVAAAASSFGDPRAMLARAPLIGDDCPSPRLATTSLDVVAAPELVGTLHQILDPLARVKLADGHCLHLTLRSQQPAETIEGAAILPVDRAPQLWIPDSSIWMSRIPRWTMHQAARFASSPVVVATSQNAVTSLGWDRKPPTWAQALGGGRPVAAPNVSADAPGLSAVVAMWQGLGGKEVAQEALAAAVLATGRAAAPTKQAALQEAESGSAAASLLPTTEQQVFRVNRGATTSRLSAVYPQGGSPSMDYPVLQVDSASLTPARQLAVKEVLGALGSARTAAIVRSAGFRDMNGTSPGGVGVDAGSVMTLQPPPDAVVTTLLQRIAVLLAPSRILVVMDLSLSMKADAGKGLSRIEFSAVAAKTAGSLIPDRAQVGLWGFARNLRGGAAWIEYEPVLPLGSADGGRSHRDAVNTAMFAMSHQLGGDGTALYRTAVAAVTAMERNYDPRAANSVVLFTDGADDDPGGPTLAQTVAQLRVAYDPQKPVRLICIGIGPGADLNALRQLAGAAGGAAYPAMDPRELPKVLFAAMNRRPGT